MTYTVTALDASVDQPPPRLCPRCALSAVDSVLEETSLPVLADRRLYATGQSVTRWHCPICFYVMLRTPQAPVVAPPPELL